MRSFFSYIFIQFGFNDSTDFGHSMVHTNLLWISVPMVTLGAIIEKMFGLNIITMGAFVTLLTLELITGISASRVKRIKIQSKKFGRFGLKLFIWVSLFFIINSLYKQYDGLVAGDFYGWLHTFIVGYVNMEYLISVLENLAVISGKENGNFVKLIRKKWMSWLDTGETPKDPREKKSKHLSDEEDRKKISFD